MDNLWICFMILVYTLVMTNSLRTGNSWVLGYDAEVCSDALRFLELFLERAIPTSQLLRWWGESVRSSERLPIEEGRHREYEDPKFALFIAPSVHHWRASHYLVGGFNPSEKYEFVIWDDSSQYVEKIKFMFQSPPTSSSSVVQIPESPTRFQ